MQPTNDDSMLPDHMNYDYNPQEYINMQPLYTPNNSAREPAAAAMIRSNSTQGNFMPQSPLLSRLSPRGSVQQRSDRERRSSAKEISTSSYSSMKNHSSIAHLEFPPPPNDLPPPPDDFLEDVISGTSIEFPPPPDSEVLPSSPELRLKLMGGGKPMPSPRTRRRDHGSSQHSSGRSDKLETYLSTPQKLEDNNLSSSPQPERAPFAVTRRRLRDLDASSKKPPVKAKPHMDSSQDGADTSDCSPASRFGVNLRHRDQSSDSCESVKSGDNLSPRSGLAGGSGGVGGGGCLSSKSNWSLNRSPGSSSAETVDTPPSPSYNNAAAANAGTASNTRASTNQQNSHHQAPPVSSRHSKDHHSRGSTDTLDGREDLAPDGSQAVQFVSDLFEGLRLQTGPPPADNGNVKKLDDPHSSVPDMHFSESPSSFLSNLKKPKSSDVDRSEETCQSSIDFKSKLRKTDVAKCAPDVPPIENDRIVDFRSQLRRTHVDKEDEIANKLPDDASFKDNMCTTSSQVNEQEMNEKNHCDDLKSGECVGNNSSEHRNSLDSSGGKRDSTNSDDDPKRFSSSSISNLKKLWEKDEKELLASNAKCDPTQTSPKYAPGLYKKPEQPLREPALHQPKMSPDSDGGKPGRLEKRVWPPTHRSDECHSKLSSAAEGGKPTVPTKPSVKNLRPPPPSGGAVKLPPPKPAGIYATPSFIKQPSVLSVSKKDKDGNKMSKSCIEFKHKSSKHFKESDSNINKKQSKLSNIFKHDSAENNGNDASPDSSNGGSAITERSRMLDETKNIETFVSGTLITDLPLSSNSCIQLVLRLEKFQVWCCSYVDHLPPQSRFHVREMLGRLDGEVRQLRVRGGGRSPDHNASAIKGVGQFPLLVTTVKDICSTLRR